MITKINKDKEKLKDIVENIDVLKNKLQDTKFKLVYDKNINIKYSLEKSIVENERYAMNLKQDIVSYLNKPEVKMYISKIVNGILEKNLPIKNNYNQLNNNLNNMRLQLHTIGKLRKAAGMPIQLDKGKNQVRLDKNTNFKYSIKLQTGTTSVANISGGSISSSDTIKLLAQAFNGVEGAIPLVAKIDEQTDEVLDYKHLNIVDKRAKRSNAILKEFS